MAGVTFLGEGSSRELANAAKDRGLDVLIVLQVKVTPNPKTGHVTNLTKLAMRDAQNRTRFLTTRELNNIKIQKARESEKDDGLDREVEKLFAFIDENLVMTSLPEEHTNEMVLARLREVLKESHDDLLPVLTEISFWNRQDLLLDDHLLSAFRRLIGDEPAVQLSSGAEDERKQVLAKLLPPK